MFILLRPSVVLVLYVCCPLFAAEGWYPIGCFLDDSQRDLKEGPMKYGYNQNACFEACKMYLYFALQANGWCVCGNAYSTQEKYEQVDDSECGANGRGGSWRNMVYGITDLAPEKRQINFTSTPPKDFTSNLTSPMLGQTTNFTEKKRDYSNVSNCEGYLMYDKLPSNWCHSIGDWAVCGIADGVVSGPGYGCTFQSITGYCECTKFKSSTPAPTQRPTTQAPTFPVPGSLYLDDYECWITWWIPGNTTTSCISYIFDNPESCPFGLFTWMENQCWCCVYNDWFAEGGSEIWIISPPVYRSGHFCSENQKYEIEGISEPTLFTAVCRQYISRAKTCLIGFVVRFDTLYCGCCLDTNKYLEKNSNIYYVDPYRLKVQNSKYIA